MRAQRIVVSEFGTMAHPDPCKSLFSRYWSHYIPSSDDTTDNALVNIMQTGDQVFAMTETPRMCRIDPNTLQTLENVRARRIQASCGSVCRTSTYQKSLLSTRSPPIHTNLLTAPS
jgi:hypothetical protein